MSFTNGCKTYPVNEEKLEKLKYRKRARRRVVYVLRDIISH